MGLDESGVVVDASELGPVLRELEKRVEGGTHGALEQIAMVMTGMVEDEYQTQGHGKWPGFAESTLRKRRKSQSPKLLQDTGNAAGSTTEAVEQDSAVAFTAVTYMVYHTSQEPRHVIPYRNPFDVDEKQLLDQAADIVLAAVAHWG